MRRSGLFVTSGARLVRFGCEASDGRVSPPSPAIQAHAVDDCRGKCLGHRHGQPHTSGSPHGGEQVEAWNEEDYTAHQHKQNRLSYPFQTLEVADDSHVGNEKDGACTQVGKSRRSYSSGLALGVDKQPYQFSWKQNKQQRQAHAEQGCRAQQQAAGLSHFVPEAGAVVVADDGLGRLGYGIPDHEEEGGIVAGNAKGAYARIAQIVHKLPVAYVDKDGHCQFAQQRRQAYLALVAEVSAGQAEALDACFQGDYA